MSMLRGVISRFARSRGAAGGTAPTAGRRTAGGPRTGSVGRTGTAGGSRSQDEAVGRGVRKLLRRFR